ncbi:hypothetical protein CONCODRAFT_132964 [Conidiobolus coronatus NRRL 28638]|uniref:Uncharacterized protein n=1 Tax=Conidiobolus coronatus (strain ATCC 28846 / CBS 209.66 / NRRL 28638) TaxID=796925 RepID=A0A137PC05_CONC2|nr:hypothetical protein CONCODRAFT_132964 [Conidiobolus coronatus NRRL 28638]|eukprot:KXN72502.1 hypothetical protein CONCODRAFT_132964 [Conidiobolus coronatus NRRL 28638]
MVIRLLINGNARLAINEIFKKNPYILILQLLNLRVGVSDAYGAELVLRSNAAVKITNNKPVLSFDPIAKKDSSYYKMLIKRYDDLFKQFNR